MASSTGLLYGTIGALAVASGYSSMAQVIYEADVAKADVQWKAPYVIFGVLLFLVGLLILSTMMTCGTGSNKLLIMGSFAVIGLSALYDVYKMSTRKPGNNDNRNWLPLIAALGVMTIGYCATSGATSSTARLLGPSSALIILLATCFVLPHGRKLGEVDGPGYILLTFGLLMGVYLNVQQQHGMTLPTWMSQLQKQLEILSDNVHRNIMPKSTQQMDMSPSMTGVLPPAFASL
jgi:hypothetical protein